MQSATLVERLDHTPEHPHLRLVPTSESAVTQPYLDDTLTQSELIGRREFLFRLRDASLLAAVAAYDLVPSDAFGLTRTLDDAVTVYYPEGISNLRIQSFFQQARLAYFQVSEYIGIHVPVSIHIGSHTQLQIEMRENYKILFPQSLLGHRVPGIWHETTHSLTKTSGEFYPEGLAEHVRFKYGNRRDKDVHPFIITDFEEDREVLPSDIRYERIGSDRRYYSKLRKRTNYDVANSFVSYLINDVLEGSREDRIRGFMNFFMGKDYSDSAHREHFGKSFKELEEGWYKMLQTRYGYKPQPRVETPQQTITPFPKHER